MLINYNARCGRDYCDAKMVMSAADAMVTNGMKEMGYEYIIISGTVKLSCTMEWFTCQGLCIMQTAGLTTELPMEQLWQTKTDSLSKLNNIVMYTIILYSWGATCFLLIP